MIQTIVAYLGHGLLATGQELLVLLGPALLLAGVLQFLTDYSRRAMAAVAGRNAYVYLTAPGVAHHELGHLLFCVLFRHKIVRFSLFHPDADGRLGYVQHAYDPHSVYQSIGNFFIGTGPIWLGAGSILALSLLLLGLGALEPLKAASSADDLGGLLMHTAGAIPQLLAAIFHTAPLLSWRFVIFAYLTFCIAAHMTLSPPDIQNALKGFVVLVVVMVLLNWGTLWLMPQDSGLILREGFLRFSAVVWAVMLLTVAINLLIAAGMFVVSVPFGRRG